MPSQKPKAIEPETTPRATAVPRPRPAAVTTPRATASDCGEDDTEGHGGPRPRPGSR